MKKIYIGLLVLNSVISFASQAKSNYLSVNDEYESIENYSFQTIIGREAGTTGVIDKDLFNSGHRLLSRHSAINDANSILDKLDSDSRYLYPKFIDSNKSVDQTDVAALYKFDTIHLNKREEPITADDIIKVNKEFDRLKQDSKLKSNSFFENLFGNSFSNKPIANKENVAKKAETVTYSYTEVNNKNEEYRFNSEDKSIVSKDYTSNVIGIIDNYNQKEMLNELNTKGLFNRNV